MVGFGLASPVTTVGLSQADPWGWQRGIDSVPLVWTLNDRDCIVHAT